MNINGVSVIIKTQKEFNRIKEILEGALYLDFVTQMSEIPTSIVLFYSDPNIYSTGSVGSAYQQKRAGCLLLTYNQFIKNYEN